MKCDISNYIKKCNVCIGHKAVQKPFACYLGERPSLSRPFKKLTIDLIGSLPKSTKGYKYILLVCDYFSKFVLSVPLRNATVLKFCEYLKYEIILLFGVPQYLIAYNGVQFKSKKFLDLCQTKIFSNALFHPQNNSTERSNRVVKTMLSCYIQENHRKCDLFLPSVSCAIRTLVHEVTIYTPYLVVFVKHYVLSRDSHKDLHLNEKCVDVERS